LETPDPQYRKPSLGLRIRQQWVGHFHFEDEGDQRILTMVRQLNHHDRNQIAQGRLHGVHQKSYNVEVLNFFKDFAAIT